MALSDFHEKEKVLKIPCTPLASADRVAISITHVLKQIEVELCIDKLPAFLPRN